MGFFDRFPLEVLTYCLLLASSPYSSFPEHLLNYDTRTVCAIPSVVRIPTVPPYPQDAHRERRRIRGVCRLWNMLIVTNPVFWKDIVIFGADTRHVRVSVERARTFPLTVLLCLPWLRCRTLMGPEHLPIRHSLENITDLLSLLRDRVAVLDVFSGCSLQMANLLPSLQPFLYSPSIRTISIHYKNRCNKTVPRSKGALRLPMMPEDIPPVNLQSILLTNISFSCQELCPLLSNLTVLDVRMNKRCLERATEQISLHDLIRHAPSLEIMRLVLPWCPKTPLFIPDIELLRLRSFTVATAEVENIVGLIVHLSVPELENFSFTVFGVRNAYPNYSGLFQKMLEKPFPHQYSIFSRLRTLVLTWACMDQHVVDSLLDVMQRLSRLGLYNVGVPQSGARKFLQRLLDSSVRKKELLEAGIIFDMVCPELNTLEVHGSDGVLEGQISELRQGLGVPFHVDFVDDQDFFFLPT